MQVVKEDRAFCLELPPVKIKPGCYWVIDEAAEQRKRRALLTIIFVAYPFFAI